MQDCRCPSVFHQVARTSSTIYDNPVDPGASEFGTPHEVIAVVLNVAVFEPRNNVERLLRRQDRFEPLPG